MPSLRFASLVLLLAWTLLAAALIACGPASGAPMVTFKAAFSSGDLGEGATVTDDFTITGSEYGGFPLPLTELLIHLPPGLESSSAGFATCASSTIAMVGPQGCPAEAVAGPVGPITMYVAFGAQHVEEQGTVQAFFGPGGTLNFALQGHSPVAIEAVMVGTFGADNPPYGRSLNISVPQIETVPGAPHASIAALTLAFGASRNEAAGTVHSVTIPRECPRGSFQWGAQAGFGEGTNVSLLYVSSCPPAALPVAGLRQAVRVTTGKVLIRLRGSTAFVPLSGEGTVPNGSELESTEGNVLITAATVVPRRTESAEVHGGRLLIDQGTQHAAQTRLLLSLPLSGCPAIGRSRGTSAGASRYRGKAPTARHLWVSEHGGSWGTNGRYVSTTVEGTDWLTIDECERSQVRVVSGRVRVRDLLHRRTRVIAAGQSYIATRARARSQR